MKTLINKTSNYLDNINSLKSKFVQVDQFGNSSSGNLYIKKPGKMRIEYDDQTKILIVVDGFYFIYVDLEIGVTQSNVVKKLVTFYQKDNFVKILKQNSLISTNDVINTNNCHISVCKTKYKNKIVILSAIDNLIKGGAGQAVQNLNMKFNFPLKTAL